MNQNGASAGSVVEGPVGSRGERNGTSDAFSDSRNWRRAPSLLEGRWIGLIRVDFNYANNQELECTGRGTAKPQGVA